MEEKEVKWGWRGCMDKWEWEGCVLASLQIEAPTHGCRVTTDPL